MTQPKIVRAIHTLLDYVTIYYSIMTHDLSRLHTEYVVAQVCLVVTHQPQVPGMVTENHFLRQLVLCLRIYVLTTPLFWQPVHLFCLFLLPSSLVEI